MADAHLHRVAQTRTTAAVAASRSRSRYIDCPVCRKDNSQYLFHKTGVRFVRCRGCGMVYVNPIGQAGLNFFPIAEIEGQSGDADLQLFTESYDKCLASLEERYQHKHGQAPQHTVHVGRFLPQFADTPTARRVGLDLVQISQENFEALVTQSDVSWLAPRIRPDTELVVLHELLEACGDPAAVVEQLGRLLPRTATVAVVYNNAGSIPAAFLRRSWPGFLSLKSAFLSTGNLTALMGRHGWVLTHQFPYPVQHTAGYVARHIAPQSVATRLVDASPVADLSLPLRTGARCAIFEFRGTHAAAREKLSIVLPVFNEHRYVAQLLDKVLAKELKIEKEVIIVESNSTDGTRDIVKRYADHPQVKLILEDRPQGKGHAVRTGLAAITGSIVLIQDADLEYDIDDYDALLEPILQRKASFVLGSRSLGLDDWKVRQFATGSLKAYLLNAAQVGFAHTYNLLYQQHITDVNTMFKVFRSECLDGLNLEGDGFDLDIELACKLARNGNAPLEVPVNYVARGFDEGKKIRFLRDAVPSYLAFFKYRFGQ